MRTHTLKIGTRIEIPVHFDTWMRGARFGTVTQYRSGKGGFSGFYFVKMDHPQIKRRVKLWDMDVPYANVIK